MRTFLAFAVAGVVLAGAAHGMPAGSFDRHGIAFTYPDGWYLATKPLSNVVQPVARFAVSTFPAHRTRFDDGPCLAGVARQRGSRGALAYLQEALGADRKLARFPPRPRVFRLPRPSENACIGRGSIEIPFREARRAFYLWLSVGPKASAETRAELRAILASLRIEPRR